MTAHLNSEHGNPEYALLAMENMDEQMRKELAHSKHDMQIAAILKSRFTMMTTVNLENGQCDKSSDSCSPASLACMRPSVENFARKASR